MHHKIYIPTASQWSTHQPSNPYHKCIEFYVAIALSVESSEWPSYFKISLSHLISQLLCSILIQGNRYCAEVVWQLKVQKINKPKQVLENVESILSIIGCWLFYSCSFGVNFWIWISRSISNLNPLYNGVHWILKTMSTTYLNIP